MGSTKSDLYIAVEQIRYAFDLDTEFPLNIVESCGENEHIHIAYETFNTVGLCSIAFLGEVENTIILNRRRNEAEQNFDCAHELMHICLHRNYASSFQCYDKVQKGQNQFLEWAANEGAAQLLLPMDEMLHMVKRNYSRFYSKENIEDFKKELSEMFFVSPIVVMFRLESLKYEIEQYLNGVDIEEIEILSERQQRSRKLQIRSLNTREEDLESKLSYVAEQDEIDYLAQEIENQLDALNPYER